MSGRESEKLMGLFIKLHPTSAEIWVNMHNLSRPRGPRGTRRKFIRAASKKHESRKKASFSHNDRGREGTYEGLEQENALPLASQLTFVRRIHTCLVSFLSYTHQGTVSKEGLI